MRSAFLLLVLLAAPSGAHAQRVSQRFSAPPAEIPLRDVALRPLKVAKWATLLAGAGSAAWGFSMNRDADTRYHEIEEICADAPTRCLRNGAGAYMDAALESDYQEVRRLDRRSRVALVAGQVTIAASVVLFILDLQHNKAPENIPWVPKELRVAPNGLGVSLALPLRAPSPPRKAAP